jgi:cation transport protein ChaC
MSNPLTKPDGDIWVFAYGSLIWHPNFEYVEKCTANLYGYHRALCIYSVEYRGTHDLPGLVFGLDSGGLCKGMAFRVLKKNAESVIHNLDKREMVTGVYSPTWANIDLYSDELTRPIKTTAYIFVADTNHKQYAGKLSDDETIRLVQQGHGKSGPCIDYLQNTLDHLIKLGIDDPSLAGLVKKILEANS